MSENKPPTRKVKVVITMRKECRDRLKKLAEASFRNVSQELELIIDLFFKDQDARDSNSDVPNTNV